MTTRHRLLRILADGNIHSGEALGASLGISRAAIWKHIAALKDLGVDVVTVKGQGYRVAGGLDLLDEGLIRDQLDASTATLLDKLVVKLETGSTNDDVMNGFANHEMAPLLVVAENQLAGKGRRGRAWVSCFARTLTFTLGWQFQQGAAVIEGLSLVVGLKVVEALQSLGLAGLGLKWPNDVVYDGRKLAGVLVELQGDPAGLCHVAIGIGLNVDLQLLPEDAIDRPWIDIQQVAALGRPPVNCPGRNVILATILNRLVPVMANLEQQNFAAYQQAWQALDVLVGKEVAMHVGEDVTVGIARGVDKHGAYRVAVGSVERYFSGGEVSLRQAS